MGKNEGGKKRFGKGRKRESQRSVNTDERKYKTVSGSLFTAGSAEVLKTIRGSDSGRKVSKSRMALKTAPAGAGKKWETGVYPVARTMGGEVQRKTQGGSQQFGAKNGGKKETQLKCTLSVELSIQTKFRKNFPSEVGKKKITKKTNQKSSQKRGFT